MRKSFHPKSVDKPVASGGLLQLRGGTLPWRVFAKEEEMNKPRKTANTRELDRL